MIPAALEALKAIKASPRGAMSVKAFNEKYGPEADFIRTVLQLHIDEVKGKLTVNSAGDGVLETFKE